MEEKKKKNHTLLKMFIFLLVIGIAFLGILTLDGGFQAQFDNSYKIKTEKNKKYNGIYSLTKVDENGKNTWDGLWLYVEKDEILVAVKYEMMTHKEMCELGKTDMYMSKEEYYKTDDSKLWDYNDYKCSYMQEIEYDIKNNPTFTFENDLLFNDLVGETSYSVYGMEWGRLQLLSSSKRISLNFNKMFNDIKKCGINPSYDEDSNQLWLSKLLKNPNSEYSSNEYKLIKHTNASSINKCPYLDGEFTISNIRKYAKNK